MEGYPETTETTETTQSEFKLVTPPDDELPRMPNEVIFDCLNELKADIEMLKDTLLTVHNTGK